MKKKLRVESLKLKVQKGFTLIELLVVMMIVIVIGSVIATILFTSLRGTNKTNSVAAIRQNGDYAISQMVKTMRDARAFSGVSNDNVIYIKSCVSSQAGALTPTPAPQQYNYLKITSSSGVVTTFICPNPPTASSGTPQNITIQGSKNVSFIDNTVATVTSCSFLCNQTSIIDYPNITIQFNLSQKNSSALLERKASINFQTSVVLRNISR